MFGCPTHVANAVGNYSCGNEQSLSVDLKGRLGFRGWVMTDWTARTDTNPATQDQPALARGLDQYMPGGGAGQADAIEKLLETGALCESAVDESVSRMVRALDRVGALQDFDHWMDDSLYNRKVALTLTLTLSLTLTLNLTLP